MKRVKKVETPNGISSLTIRTTCCLLHLIFIDVSLLWLHQYSIIMRWMSNHTSLIIARYSQYGRTVQTELSIKIMSSFHFMSSKYIKRTLSKKFNKVGCT
jgi:hypothetical protein